MVVTHKLAMDLTGKIPEPWIEVMQWDAYTHEIRIQMRSGCDPWQIPENATALVYYRKPDRKCGGYDALPNGETAWRKEDDMLYVVLAPQLLTVPGTVKIQICMIQEEKILHTVPVEVRVQQAESGSEGEKSEDFICVTGFLPAPSQAKTGQYIRVMEVDELGRVVRVETADVQASGGADERQIQSIVEDYLEKNLPNTGEDGFSPEVTVTETEDGAVITVTDRDGTTTATLYNGQEGAQGIPGPQGPRGETGPAGPEGAAGESSVYILSEGETIEDAPADADVVIDPNGEAVEIPEGGGGVSSWNDLTDRPFYSEYQKSIIYSGADLAPDPDMGMIVVNESIPLIVGQEYTVKWNGVDYACVCIQTDTNVFVLGNMAVAEGEDTGEPFCIITYTDQGMTIVAPLDGSESATVSITGELEVIHPLPAKYLPELKGQKQIIIDIDNQTASSSFETAWDMSVNELQAVMSVLYNGVEYSVTGLERTEFAGQGIELKRFCFSFTLMQKDTANVHVYTVHWDTVNGESSITIDDSNGRSFLPKIPDSLSDSYVLHAAPGRGGMWRNLDTHIYDYLTLRSPDGTKYEITVDNSGTITATIRH